MTDISGWQQSPDQIRTPSPLEIAIVSGRICRYAGNLPCSLLTHVLVGARVVWHLLRHKSAAMEQRLETFAWWMLHDAHELITGDFAPHKCNDVKAWQTRIDDANACIYGIDRDLVDEVVIHSADLLSRWLEAHFYGSAKFMETFEAHHKYTVPSPEMQRETIGIFRSEFGRFSSCVVDENENPGLHFPVVTYHTILEAILSGQKRKAVEYYDGMVVELGL